MTRVRRTDSIRIVLSIEGFSRFLGPAVELDAGQHPTDHSPVHQTLRIDVGQAVDRKSVV